MNTNFVVDRNNKLNLSSGKEIWKPINGHVVHYYNGYEPEIIKQDKCFKLIKTILAQKK